jgi:PAS domain S-box-containing protein
LGSPTQSLPVYLGSIATLVMVATFVIVGWLTWKTARTAQAELETQATKKSILISRSLDRAILNMKNAATALSHSHEIQIDDVRGFYNLAKSFAKNLDLQIVLRDVDREQQLVNTSLPWGETLPGGGIPIAKEAEDEAWRTGQAAHSDVFYGKAVGKHFVAAFATVISTTSRRYSLSVAVETNRFTSHLDSAQLGPDNLVTVFDRRRTIVTRSQEHDQYTGRDFNRDRPYDGGTPEATGILRGPNLSGVPYQWNYARSSQTGWVVSVGTPIAVLAEPVNEAAALLAIAALVLIFLTVLGTRLGSTYLSRRIGRLGVDRPPTRDEFQTLFESAPYGVIIVDTSSLMVLCNARMQAEFGYARDELIGRSVDVLIPERFRAAHARYQRDYLTGPDARAMGSGLELYGRRKDGSEFPVEVGLRPIKAGIDSFVMVTVVDISGRKRELQLAATLLTERERFQRQLIRAEEAERSRIARELHDEAGQSLTAVGLAVRELEGLISDKDRGRLRRVQGQLADLGRTLHNVARQMRPASLDDLGLDAALSTYAMEWSERYGIKVDLQGDLDLDDVTPEHAVVVYRIVQEALTNVARHAQGATTVSIVANCLDRQLRLTIEDNGCGFANGAGPQTSDDPGGIGIPGMRERLTLVGGELQIESTAGAGATLYVRMPLIHQKEPA